MGCGRVVKFSVPSSSGVGPVIGAEVPFGSAREDFAYSIWFEETREQHWFSPHLLERIDSPRD